MFYTYVLISLVNKDIYIGYSCDLRERIKSHNLGRVKSTKAYRPWKLIYYEAYLGKYDATKREKQLKMHAVKDELLKRLINSLSET